jgi:hypothetical protein
MAARETQSLSDPAIKITLFKDSYEPFIAPLEESGIEFTRRPPPVGIVMNSGLEIGISAVTMALTRVIVAYLKARQRGKLIVTTKGNAVVHFQAEGLSQSELERVQAQVRNMMVLETKPKKSKSAVRLPHP